MCFFPSAVLSFAGCRSGDFSLSSRSPVTDSCSATLKGPDQTNSRPKNSVAFCGRSAALFISGFDLCLNLPGVCCSALITYFPWFVQSLKNSSRGQRLVPSAGCNYCRWLHTALWSSLTRHISNTLYNSQTFPASCHTVSLISDPHLCAAHQLLKHLLLFSTWYLCAFTFSLSVSCIQRALHCTVSHHLHPMESPAC